MKRFVTFLIISLTCLSLFATSAEAKRFGGGGSFGKQRSMTPQQAPKSPSAAPAAAPAKPGNKWLGPLAGLAIGAGLAAMFASMGLGGGMGTILMIVLAIAAVIFLVPMFRKKHAPAMQYAGSGSQYATSYQPQPPLTGGAVTTDAPKTGNIPADFPAESFLRSAKTSFIRLQAANDRKDLNDVREYTTPEMFAEISMQMQERDATPQKTDVISIQADLLEVNNEGNLAIASVRFTGQLSENKGSAEAVDEIWHVQKDLSDDNSVWLLAGIQQTPLH